MLVPSLRGTLICVTRTERKTQTPYGAVRVKAASGWGVTREKPEYEDLARIARENGLSLAEAAASLET